MGEEKRLILEPVELLESVVCITTVGIGIICDVGGLERGASALHLGIGFVVFLHQGDGLFGKITSPLPGAFGEGPRAIWLGSPALPVVLGMMVDFADRDCFVAVVLEMLRQAKHIRHGLAKWGIKVIDF